MTWEHITELCQGELQRVRAHPSSLATNPFSGALDEVSAVLAAQRDTEQAVTAAVRQFAATRTWPELSALEGFMLGLRLDHAAGLAALLAEQPAPWTDDADSSQTEHRLGWLLLFAWEQEGFPRLERTIQLRATSLTRRSSERFLAFTPVPLATSVLARKRRSACNR